MRLLHNDVVKQTVETIIIHKIKGSDKTHGKINQMCYSRDQYFTLPIKYKPGVGFIV